MNCNIKFEIFLARPALDSNGRNGAMAETRLCLTAAGWTKACTATACVCVCVPIGWAGLESQKSNSSHAKKQGSSRKGRMEWWACQLQLIIILWFGWLTHSIPIHKQQKQPSKASRLRQSFCPIPGTAPHRINHPQTPPSPSPLLLQQEPRHTTKHGSSRRAPMIVRLDARRF